MKPTTIAIIAPNGASAPAAVLGNNGGSAPVASVATEQPSGLKCERCKRKLRQHVDHTPGAVRGWYTCACPKGPFPSSDDRRKAEGK
jgi:hypothetical protein